MGEKKNCPYCGNEMEVGYLVPERCSKMWWLPKGVDLPNIGSLIHEKRLRKKGAIIFKNFALSIINMKSYRCEHCGTITIFCNEVRQTKSAKECLKIIDGVNKYSIDFSFQILYINITQFCYFKKK